MIIEAVIFVITFIVVYVFYVYKSVHYYFDKKGVKYIPGGVLTGNVLESATEKRNFVEDIIEVYNAFPEEKYVGFIEGTTPVILIRDPDLIKNITVKDFDHFVDHREFFPQEIDKFLGSSVIQLKGDKWRDMRATLSPAFTGAKMRHIMPFMDEISHNVVEYLKENATDEVDMIDIFRRYTNDVIASTGFGLEMNSLRDKDNGFYLTGRTLLEFTSSQKMLLTALAFFPYLIKKLGIQLYPKKTRDFFENVVSSTIEFRKKNNVERADMLQLLIEASKGTLKSNTNETNDIGFAAVQEELKSSRRSRQWTMDEITGQVIIFYTAGYDTAATGLIMCVHELALNPDVEEKLYQEIREFKEKRGKLTYDNINELKYFDCVLNESFRKWSAAVFMDRTCTKAYDLPAPREGGKPCRLQPGDLIYNMVTAIHKDPKYYPDPEKFDPERFSDDNKHKIKPFTFMPFGAGPRNCIGSRFAILEIKVLIYYLILNFKILKCPKTMDPIVLFPGGAAIKPKDGSYVRLEARL